MSIWPAICLFERPRASNATISRSRVVRGRESLLELRHHLLFGTPSAGALNAASHRIKQFLISKWFGQEFYGAGFHGPYRHGDIAMAGDEHDWCVNVSFRELGLKVETAWSGQPDIQNDAIRCA